MKKNIITYPEHCTPELLSLIRLLLEKQQEGFFGKVEIHLAGGRIERINCNESMLGKQLVERMGMD